MCSFIGWFCGHVCVNEFVYCMCGIVLLQCVCLGARVNGGIRDSVKCEKSNMGGFSCDIGCRLSGQH